MEVFTLRCNELLLIDILCIDLHGNLLESSIKWYDLRNGGDLVDGAVKTIKAGGPVALGYAPVDKAKDLVILIQSNDFVFGE